jgi:hypothetical protein
MCVHEGLGRVTKPFPASLATTFLEILFGDAFLSQMLRRLEAIVVGDGRCKMGIERRVLLLDKGLDVRDLTRGS